MYNKDNVFYKILQNEIPSNKVYEDENVLAFYDINPSCKVHVLAITKKLYVSFDDFAKNAEPCEISTFFQTVSKIATLLGLNETGYRILSNSGENSNQIVKHFHVHILGGEKLKD